MSNFYRDSFIDWFNDRSSELAKEWMDDRPHEKQDLDALIEGNHHESDDFYKWAEDEFNMCALSRGSCNDPNIPAGFDSDGNHIGIAVDTAPFRNKITLSNNPLFNTPDQRRKI